MRKLALSFALLFGILVIGTPTLSLAASRGGGSHGGGGGASRGGGGASRGGGSVSGASRGVSGGSSYRGGGGYGGSYRGGYGGGYGYRGGYGFGLGFGLGLGYGYPWYGGYYGYPYYSSYYSYPAYAYDDSYYADPGPVTYAQPAYAQPAYTQPTAPAPVYSQQQSAPLRAYQAPPPGRNANGTMANSQSNMYLFAFPDGSVQVAVAYWTENGTLHYVTRDKQQKTCALTDLDQATTRQLNRERGVTINLQ